MISWSPEAVVQGKSTPDQASWWKNLDSTGGTITVSGERLEKMKLYLGTVSEYRRKLHSVVFQDFRLLKDRNVPWELAFAQRVIGRPLVFIVNGKTEVASGSRTCPRKYKALSDELLRWWAAARSTGQSTGKPPGHPSGRWANRKSGSKTSEDHDTDGLDQWKRNNSPEVVTLNKDDIVNDHA